MVFLQVFGGKSFRDVVKGDCWYGQVLYFANMKFQLFVGGYFFHYKRRLMQ